jgi:hypothetical protein
MTDRVREVVAGTGEEGVVPEAAVVPVVEVVSVVSVSGMPAVSAEVDAPKSVVVDGTAGESSPGAAVSLAGGTGAGGSGRGSGLPDDPNVDVAGIDVAGVCVTGADVDGAEGRVCVTGVVVVTRGRASATCVAGVVRGRDVTAGAAVAARDGRAVPAVVPPVLREVEVLRGVVARDGVAREGVLRGAVVAVSRAALVPMLGIVKTNERSGVLVAVSLRGAAPVPAAGARPATRVGAWMPMPRRRSAAMRPRKSRDSEAG